jgi:hypothetical protein
VVAREIPVLEVRCSSHLLLIDNFFCCVVNCVLKLQFFVVKFHITSLSALYLEITHEYLV